MDRKNRTKARSATVKFLYQCEAEKIYYFSINHFEDFAKHFKLNAEVYEFTAQCAKGVLESLKTIDQHISKVSTNWSVERMPIIDRSILRLAIYELLETDSPVKVILDEAIKLAKEYGTEFSGKFVNGILDKLAKQVRT